VVCKLQGVSHIVSKRHKLSSINGFKLDVSFYPPSLNSAAHFIARLPRRRSANETQPKFAKRWMVNCANNPPQRSRCRPSRKKLIHSYSIKANLPSDYNHSDVLCLRGAWRHRLKLSSCTSCNLS